MTSKTQGASPKKGPAFNIFSTGTVPVAEKRRNTRWTMIRKMARVSYDYLMSDIVSYTGYIPPDSYFAGLFNNVPVDGVEAQMYDPLTDAANQGQLLGNFKLVATPNKPDPSDPTRQKMDCAMYAKGDAPPKNGRAKWPKVELSFEVKPKGLQDDPFDDDNWPHYPKTSERRQDNLGQIMTYSILVFDNQHRTHHFTVVIFGTMARIIYWDRSSAIFTEKFNYKAEPHKLGKFLWCYSRLSPAQRGHDTTVVPVLPGSHDHELMLQRAVSPLVVNKNVVGEHARKAFMASVDNEAPCFKMTVHDEKGEKTFLVGKPNFVASGLVGRGTRGYVAIDTDDENGPFVYLKDCWRVEHERIRKEGDVLTQLNAAKVPNIPTVHCHGDVPGQRTRGKRTFEKVYSKGHVCFLKTHQHYRMAVKEVGMPLWEFKNGKELVRVLLDCVRAHAGAYAAGLIHRDISVGNILIYPDPETGKVTGMLADWELSKKVDDDSDEPRQPDRTGTWQFTSVGVLNDSKKAVKIPDELESLLHVLLYIALHFIPHNCKDVSEFVCSFFDSAQQDNLDFLCGEKKERTIMTGKLVMKGGVQVAFLREPIKYKSQPTVDCSVDPSSQCSSTDIATTSAAVEEATLPTTENDVFASGSSSSLGGLPVPPEAFHPIHHIILDLLPRFAAYYSVHNPDTVSPGKAPAAAEADPDIVADYEAEFAEFVPADSNQASGITPEIREQADSLNTHKVFGSILYRHLVKDVWPENDKQPDQVDPKYSKKPYVLKRSRLHEDEFETPSGKRPVTGAVPQSRTA